MSKIIDSSSASRRALPALVLMSALLVSCDESTTAPEPDPGSGDTATYDLVYEQSLFPISSSELRFRRNGETTDQPLFGERVIGFEPSVSRDGRTIVYQGYGGVPGDDYDLWIVRAGQPRQRIPLPVGDQENAPAISPDGQRVAFIRRLEGGNTELWVSKLDGSERLHLSPDVEGVTTVSNSPAWSRDGQRIAWSFGAPGAMRINVINADGTGRQVVSAGVAGGSDIDAEWSPDGTRLVFARTPTPALSDLVVLTLATGAERAFGLPRRSRYPAWSPDGGTIVFAAMLKLEDTDLDLYSMKLDGTQLTQLTDDDINQRHPAFVRR